jgi:hypothetical protein
MVPTLDPLFSGISIPLKAMLQFVSLVALAKTFKFNAGPWAECIRLIHALVKYGVISPKFGLHVDNCTS